MFRNLEFEIIKKGTKDYPIQLYDLENIPKELYIVGNKKLLEEFSIAVVGSRNCTEVSSELASQICYNLALKGIVIVSGLARGIDRVAHESCLRAKSKTIAVLGGGFDNLYPKENINLLYEILEKDGLVITEYAPDIPCLKTNFVARNRIIAGLSQGIVVVEAKEKSGSLTTAKFGFKMHRNVFSCPGDVRDFRYEGSNKLLVEGANCILNYQDVLKFYPDLKIKIDRKEEKNLENIPNEYLEIYSLLIENEKSIDELKRILNISISELNSKLTLMEIERICEKVARKNI